MSNPNWNRWILASLADFKQVASGLSLPVLVETLDQRTQAFMAARDRAEVRITGPSCVSLATTTTRHTSMSTCS